MQKKRIEAVIVHTAATPGNIDVSIDVIRKYHKAPPPAGRGWRDVGYHRYIRQNGAIENGRALDDDKFISWDEVGAHLRGGNGFTVGICCSGNGDVADFTPLQKASLVLECARICALADLGSEWVLGHAESAEKLGVPIPYKTCPGKMVDMDQIRALVEIELRARDQATIPDTPIAKGLTSRPPATAPTGVDAILARLAILEDRVLPLEDRVRELETRVRALGGR